MPPFTQSIKEKAKEMGFDTVGIAKPDAINHAAHGLIEFIEAGHHGTMTWMEDRAKERSHPNALWSEVRSVIMVGMNYGPDHDPRDLLSQPNKANVSVYARGRDYHDIIKKKLKHLARWIVQEKPSELKVFVDTAPVMEKPLAAAAGLGWQGKHTNMVSNDFGSWLFLGAIYTTLDLTYDTPHTDQCGSCSACLDACPTDAFVAPYKIDARRCISYLTIELKQAIPVEFRRALGNRIYGCDDCLAACPWNKFAQISAEAQFHAKDHLKSPNLAELVTLNDANFRQLFSGSPIKRIGRDRFIRNVLYAIGNSGDKNHLPAVEQHIHTENPIIRDAALWAKTELSA